MPRGVPAPLLLESMPKRTAEPKKRRFVTPGTGPPTEPSNRLRPTLFDDALSVSHEPEPCSVLPPARVVYEITPDCASENSTPSAPVVTEASSIALVPRLTRGAPLLVPRIGAPSTYTLASPGRPPRIDTPALAPDSTTPGVSEMTDR